jgi:hypothetical protein
MGFPTVRLVTLHPHQWTPLPETNVTVWLDDDPELTVYQWDGIWDLSPLTRSGRVLAWAAFADQPAVRPWPLLPPPRCTRYRSAHGSEGQ